MFTHDRRMKVELGCRIMARMCLAPSEQQQCLVFISVIKAIKVKSPEPFSVCFQLTGGHSFYL